MNVKTVVGTTFILMIIPIIFPPFGTMFFGSSVYESFSKFDFILSDHVNRAIVEAGVVQNGYTYFIRWDVVFAIEFVVLLTGLGIAFLFGKWGRKFS
jgi:hypothetical protein